MSNNCIKGDGKKPPRLMHALSIIFMKKVLKNNTIVFLSYFCLWLIVDVIDVKLYRFKGFEQELVVGLSIVLISFLIDDGIFDKACFNGN